MFSKQKSMETTNDRSTDTPREDLPLFADSFDDLHLSQSGLCKLVLILVPNPEAVEYVTSGVGVQY